MMVKLVQRFLSSRSGVELVVGKVAQGLSSWCHTMTVKLVQRLSSSCNGVELARWMLNSHDGC